MTTPPVTIPSITLPSIVVTIIMPVFGVDVVWTIIGAAIFVALLSLVMGGRRYGGYRPFRRRYY